MSAFADDRVRHQRERSLVKARRAAAVARARRAREREQEMRAFRAWVTTERRAYERWLATGEQADRRAWLATWGWMP